MDNRTIEEVRKVEMGFPIEYECDGIIYDGLFLREPEIRVLEKRLKEINKITDLEQQCKKQKEVINKAIEYITSYESISIIQGLTDTKNNKQLDEKTMTKMTNRYLLVHDKLLQILENV